MTSKDDTPPPVEPPMDDSTVNPNANDESASSEQPSDADASTQTKKTAAANLGKQPRKPRATKAEMKMRKEAAAAAEEEKMLREALLQEKIEELQDAQRLQFQRSMRSRSRTPGREPQPTVQPVATVNPLTISDSRKNTLDAHPANTASISNEQSVERSHSTSTGHHNSTETGDSRFLQVPAPQPPSPLPEILRSLAQDVPIASAANEVVTSNASETTSNNASKKLRQLHPVDEEAATAEEAEARKSNSAKKTLVVAGITTTITLPSDDLPLEVVEVSPSAALGADAWSDNDNREYLTGPLEEDAEYFDLDAVPEVLDSEHDGESPEAGTQVTAVHGHFPSQNTRGLPASMKQATSLKTTQASRNSSRVRGGRSGRTPDMISVPMDISDIENVAPVPLSQQRKNNGLRNYGSLSCREPSVSAPDRISRGRGTSTSSRSLSITAVAGSKRGRSLSRTPSESESRNNGSVPHSRSASVSADFADAHSESTASTTTSLSTNSQGSGRGRLRELDISRTTSQSDIQFSAPNPLSRSKPSSSSALSSGTRVFRVADGIRYNKLGQRLPRGSNPNKYSNDDFDSPSDKIIFRQELLPTLLAFMGTRRDAWTSTLLNDVMKEMWTHFLPKLSWEAWSRHCKYLANQRIYEWRSKFYSTAQTVVEKYLNGLASSRIVRKESRVRFIEDLTRRSDEMAPNFLWKTFPNDYLQPQRGSGAQDEMPEYGGLFRNELVLEVLCCHLRVIKNANHELKMEVYERLEGKMPEVVVRDRDPNEDPEYFNFDPRAALALSAAAIDRVMMHYTRNDSGEYDDDPKTNKFTAEKAAATTAYFMDLACGLEEPHWLLIMVEAEEMLQTDDPFTNLANGTDAHTQEAAELEEREIRAKRRRIADLDHDRALLYAKQQL